MKRELEGETKGDARTDLGRTVPEVGWTQDKTASDLGVSRQAVSKAKKIANAVKEHPDLAKHKKGSG